MRIVITSPPKMGNKWIKCLLSQVYDLKWINGDDSPDTNVEEFRKFIADGRFPDGTIFHQHCRYKAKLCDAIDDTPAHLVTIIRDPYDAFVSMYYWIQSRTDFDKEKGKVRPKERPRDTMYGKPLEDPAILDYLATGFGDQMRRGEEWIHSGRAIVVRYEDLHRDAVGALTAVTNQIEPVDRDRIDKAIDACSVDNMRKMSKRLARHVRVGKVGDSRDKLGNVHLTIFRDQYADLIKALGYEVR
ncbi:MAG: sulfotransferase domain-containing protein [Thermomicrobiales bacterium]